MNILVAGSGVISREYLKVLLAKHLQPIVVGRGEANILKVQREFPQVEAKSGGLQNWLLTNKPPQHAIVALPIENLVEATEALLESGVKSILVEKPFTYSLAEAQKVSDLADRKNAKVFVAFNRRNYVSVIEARKLIEKDGGVSSFHFDFSEAIFRIDETKFSIDSQMHWGIANSSHVIDTAFYLGGKPAWIEARQYGKSVVWHPAGSIFTGIGETTGGLPFSYHANWGCPGKWNIEIMTPKRKLLFSPMERLHQQAKGSFKVDLLDLDYSIDINHKPGFYKQVSNWLSKPEFLMRLKDLEDELVVYKKIFNY